MKTLFFNNRMLKNTHIPLSQKLFDVRFLRTLKTAGGGLERWLSG